MPYPPEILWCRHAEQHLNITEASVLCAVGLTPASPIVTPSLKDHSNAVSLRICTMKDVHRLLYPLITPS